ncbi:MAG: hypothetical protein ACI37Q_09100 [Candidatus Gastranaerophilaceae bacterium]
MKKIVVSMLTALVVSSAAYAECGYECVAPYDMNSKFRTVTAAVTGMNSITENRVEAAFKKEILKIASAEELKVDIDSYSPRDLKNGIFKSMSLNGKNIVINDIHLTSLELKSLCDFNYIKTSGGNTVVKEDFPMSFNMTITPEDLNKTMLHSRYQKIIDDLNTLGKNYAAGLKVSSTKVSIKNNKFYFIVGFEVPFVLREQKIVIQADVRIRNGQIDYQNSRLVSGHFSMDLKKIDFLMKCLNPLNFSINILKNKDAKVTVRNVEIKDNVITANGIVIIPKD